MFRKLLDKLPLLDLFQGLTVTGAVGLKALAENFNVDPEKRRQTKVTVEYPEERMEPAGRFRGMFRLDEERCIKCTICAIDCPIDIIYIDWHTEEREGKKIKLLDRFDIDVKRCMFCGICEESCPTEPKSIWLTTKTYELATYDRNKLYFDKHQLSDWEDRPEYGEPSVPGFTFGREDGE